MISGLHESVLSGDLKYKIIKSVSEDAFNELELLKEQLNRIRMKEIRIRDAYENGIDSLQEYKLNKTRIQDEKSDIQNKISKLTAPSSTSEETDLKEQLIRNIKSAIRILEDPAMDYEKKGTAIRSVVDKIIYDKKSEHIDFFFYLAQS